MEGQFITAKKEKSRLRLAFWLAVGAVACGAGNPVLLICAVLAAAVEILVMRFNRRAFFRMEQDRICARYHWFGKLACDLADVAFVHAGNMTLNILLRNGKRHEIGFLANASQLCDELRRRTFCGEPEAFEGLWEKLNQVQAKRRRGIRWTIGCCAMLFVNIGLTVLLTGGREMSAFSERDQLVFSLMAAVELGMVIAVFGIAGKCGRWMVDMEHLRHRLQKAAIAAQILPGTCVKAVYTDAQASGRMVVCTLPNDDSVYYIVQGTDDDFRLVTEETSGFYGDMAELMEPMPPELIDITSWFPCAER